MELALLVITHAKHAHRQHLALLAHLHNSEPLTLQHLNVNATVDISIIITPDSVFLVQA
jgi:hypothetical protein